MQAFYRLIRKTKTFLFKISMEDKLLFLSEYRICNKVRWIVTTISKYTLWESLCLVQALTVQKMLKKRNISTTIYLGVNKLNNEMKAHAWIRCGKMYITGGNGAGYATVAKFSNE